MKALPIKPTHNHTARGYSTIAWSISHDDYEKVTKRQGAIEATRRHLREALDRDLALYERHVPGNTVLVQYVELTKEVLLNVIEEMFNDKLHAIEYCHTLPIKTDNTTATT